MEKKLFRIKNKDSKLGGVALGLSEYFDTDVSLIRALFVILLFVPHLHLGFIYFILWLVLPVKNEYNYASTAADSTETSNFSNLNFTNMSNHSKQGSMTGGIILIVLGSIFAIKEFFDVNIFHFVGKLWPLFLVGLGVWLIVRDRPIPPSE
jgi:phage shock protein C